MEIEEKYPIRAVARRTGLTHHVIRVWERRYGAVSPMRTSTNRRLYSEAEIERLLLLRRTTLAGHNIGQIAQLPKERLLALVTANEVAMSESLKRKGPSPSSDESSPQTHLEICIAAVEQLDPKVFEAALTCAAVSLSRPALIEEVIAPLMQKVGDLWRKGSLRIAHEHLASTVVRIFLGGMRWNVETPASAPNLIVSTPAGQLHEFGALIAAATAESEGWRVTYLGPNLPAEEIAGAAQQNQAKAVALSIVYPADDPHLGHELTKLHRCLSEEVVLLVGGRAAEAYGDVLDRIGAVRLNDMPSLRAKLESIRYQQPIR